MEQQIQPAAPKLVNMTTGYVVSVPTVVLKLCLIMDPEIKSVTSHLVTTTWVNVAVRVNAQMPWMIIEHVTGSV